MSPAPMIRRVFDSTFFSLIGRVCSTSANLLVVFYISRFFAAPELGAYGLAFFFMQLFSVLGSMGGGQFFCREIAANREEDQLQASSWAGFRLSSTVGALFSLLLIPLGLVFFPQVSPGLFLLSLFSGFLWGLEMNLQGFLLGLEKMRDEALSQVVQLILLFVLLFSGFMEMSLERIFWVRIFIFLSGLFYRVWVLPGRGRNFFIRAGTKPGDKKVFAYFSLNMIVDFVSRMVDIPVLAGFISMQSLGTYFLVIRVYLAFSLLFEVATNSLTPFISRLYAGREEMGMIRFHRIALLYTFAGGLLIGLLMVAGAPLIISLFQPREPAEAVFMLRLLALTLPFRGVSCLLGVMLGATRFQKLRFQINLCWTVFYFIITIGAVILAGRSGALMTRIAADIGMALLLALAVTRNLLREKPRV